MSDLYNILMGSDPEAGASAQALAQAIRGNRQLAAANALGAGGLGGLAAAQSAEAKQDADLSEKALTARAHYTPQRQEEAALQEPAVAQYLTQALGKLGMPPPDGASARGLRMMLPTALSLHNNEANNAAKLAAAEQGRYYKELAAGEKSKNDDRKFNQTAGANFSRDIRQVALSPRGIGGQAYASINRAERAITTLAAGQDTPEAWGELAVAAASVAGGGVPHESVIKSLKPDGINFSIARAKEYLSGMPVAVGADGWQEWYRQFFDRERKLMTDQYRESVIRAAAPHTPYMQANPELAHSVLRQHLVDDAFDPKTFYPTNAQTMGGVPYQGGGQQQKAPGPAAHKDPLGIR